MSIKGTTQELFIGKTEANIINSKKQRHTILYDSLKKLEYWLADSENGMLLFVTNENQKYSFVFKNSANDAILRTINYIKDKRPEIPVEVLSKEQRPKVGKSSSKIKHQKCKNCGKEYDSEADICPYCNYSNTDTHFKWLFLGGVVVACIVIISFVLQYLTFIKPLSNTINEVAYTAQNEVTEATVNKIPTTESFSTTLVAGHYVVGLDIPSGTYSFFSKKELEIYILAMAL